MNQKEIKDLIDFLIERDISEFELERGDVRIRVKRGAEQTSAPANGGYYYPPAAPPAPVPAGQAPPTPAEESAPGAAPAVEDDSGLYIVHSPIVGTFYESPSPGAPAYVKPGDKVSVGQVLCIVEAMKLMNEIEAEQAGEIVKRFVNNAQPIEYGQALFAIRPGAE